MERSIRDLIECHTYRTPQNGYSAMARDNVMKDGNMKRGTHCSMEAIPWRNAIFGIVKYRERGLGRFLVTLFLDRTGYLELIYSQSGFVYFQLIAAFPVNRGRWANGVLLLDRRLRRRTSNKITLGQRLVFAGLGGKNGRSRSIL